MFSCIYRCFVHISESFEGTASKADLCSPSRRTSEVPPRLVLSTLSVNTKTAKPPFPHRRFGLRVPTKTLSCKKGRTLVILKYSSYFLLTALYLSCIESIGLSFPGSSNRLREKIKLERIVTASGLPQMALVRRFQSIAIAVVSTLLFLILLQFLVANTSIRVVPLALSNSSLPELRPYIPESIWWTSETKLEPRFAYALYATDEAYFCNAVCDDDE